MRFWFKISICQNGMVHEGCWMNFLTMVGKLEASIVCVRESTRRVQLSSNQAAVDRVRCVGVEDLVLSQENNTKRHWSACEILHETAIRCSSVHRIIHRDLQLKCFKQRCLKPITSLISSHSLINNLIVCKKSCFCSIINCKLNNKEVK